MLKKKKRKLSRSKVEKVMLSKGCVCDALREKTSETQALQWLLRHIPLYFTAWKPTFPKPLACPQEPERKKVK